MKSSQISLAFACLALAPASLLADADSDQKIVNTAESSYTFHTVLQDQVKVKAKDGVVTLTGTVQDPEQKSRAEDTASNISGVSRVRDRIKVATETPEHSDAWIALKVKTVLLTRANVSATHTTVDVKDGVVTLTGTADNQAQRELTEAYAKDIDGVKTIHNDIEVRSAPSGDMGSSPAASTQVDDASITAEVKYELLSHRATSALSTKVSTSEGVVLVRGEAGSSAERDLVTKLATDVRGVKSVTNEMTVKPGM